MEGLEMKGAYSASAFASLRPRERQESVAETQLPKPQSVQEAKKPEQLQDADRRAASQPTRKSVDIDPETAEFVFKAVDTQTGETVNQLPAETILKLRAYAREGVEARETRAADEDAAYEEPTHVNKEA